MSLTAPGFWTRLMHTPCIELVTRGVTGSLDWRSMVAKEELPAPIAETIYRVVGRLGLWRREKSEVARELIAHFQDGLGGGASVEQLVERFGDPSTAARLIRRAKRRCRPLWWQAWWCASRTTLLLLVFYAVAACALIASRPIVSTDYLARLNALTGESRPEDRGWPLYREAFDLVAEEAPRDTSSSYSLVWGTADNELFESHYSELSPDQRSEADAWLDEHTEVLWLFREAAGKPTYGVSLAVDRADYPADFRRVFRILPADPDKPNPHDNGTLFSILLPHVQENRSVALCLRLHFGRAVAQNDSAAAVEDLHAMLGVGRHAGESASLVCAYVEHGLFLITLDAFARSMRGDATLWSDDQLRDLAHEFSHKARPPEHYLLGDKQMALDTVQRVYSKHGAITIEGLKLLQQWDALSDKHAWFLASDESALLQAAGAFSLPAVSLYFDSRKETEELIDRYYAYANRAVSRSLWDHEKTLGVWPQDSFETNPVARLSFPAIEIARMLFERCAGKRDGALIGIALELYHREHGSWPESLDELTPAFLPEAPIDRINGGPLTYRLIDGQPVVYSRGVDGDDDLGRLPRNLDPVRIEKREYGSMSPHYRVTAPLSAEKVAQNKDDFDGDWALWSVEAPRYMDGEEGD